jgi:ABC-type transport system substrate-binding protein
MLFPIHVEAQFDQPNDLNVGPYVDELKYIVIPNVDSRIAAIFSGDIEMDNEIIFPDNSPWIPSPDISLAEILKNGYGHITINCRDYPLNISGFRRAFAYAYDKRTVQQNIMLGYAYLLDSLVPYTNSFNIEDEFGGDYYDDQSEIGNQILDDLGFEIQGDGWRTAPNGSAIHIEIIYDSGSPDVDGGIAQVGVWALQALHINASTKSGDTDPATLVDFDMVVLESDFYDFNVDWLAEEYWSENADDPLLNLCGFRNDSFDTWRNQLLRGATYEEVYEAAAEMQKILHYNVPRLVVHEEVTMQLYRNDQFTGHFRDSGRNLANPWTMRKIHRIDGSPGGIIPIGIGEDVDSFNFFISNSSACATIFPEIWPSLYMYAPDTSPYPYLVEDMIIETHEDNWIVPEGHTRFTFDIIQNATWSDGYPLTAEDVAFTFLYVLESGAYGNPAAADLTDLTTISNPTPYRVILEFQNESYWHFSKFAYDYIIPRRIFNNETGIGYAGWNTWNPVFDPAEPYVTSGPFFLFDFMPDEYVLTKNTNFAFLPQEEFPPPDHTATFPDTSTTTGPNSSPTGTPNGPIPLASIVISGFSSVVIVVMVILIIKNKQGGGS